jgi:hypothetical protein
MRLNLAGAFPARFVQSQRLGDKYSPTLTGPSSLTSNAESCRNTFNSVAPPWEKSGGFKVIEAQLRPIARIPKHSDEIHG